MSGILTIAAALNLGGGTLTINGANTHPLSGIVSNGTLAFAMTTPGASVTGLVPLAANLPLWQS